MNALRDGNTHKSFKRVSTPPEPPNKPVPTPLEPPNRPLLFLPQRPRRPGRPPPSPRSQHEPRVSLKPMMGSLSRSPLPRSRIVSAPPGSPSTEKRSSDNPLISRYPLLLKRGRFHVVIYPNQSSFGRAVTPP